MQLTQTRFGTIDFESDDILTFEEGLVGFPQLNQYLLLNHNDDSPFRWLQSIDEPGLAFLLADPWHFVEAYEVEIPEDTVKRLGLTSETPHSLWTTARIPDGNTQEMTINLAAPIVLNLENRRGKQVVLEAEAYNIRHRVFQLVESEREKQVA
jgi:flagellar assembly factor FliW